MNLFLFSLPSIQKVIIVKLLADSHPVHDADSNLRIYEFLYMSIIILIFKETTLSQ